MELGLLNRELARPDPPALYDWTPPPRPARTGPAFSFPASSLGGGAETGQALVDRCREGLLGCLHELGLLNRELARPDPPALYDLDAPPRPCARTGPAFSFPASSLASASRRVSAWALIEPTPRHAGAHLLSPQAGTVLCLRAIARSDDGDCLLQAAPALPLDSFPRCTDPC